MGNDFPTDCLYARKRWTANECRALVEADLLLAGKFELIEGDIVLKPRQSRLHILVVTHIRVIMTAIFGNEHVQSQADISIGDLDVFNDPEPDIAVLTGTMHDYLDRNPHPAHDVRLVVEASETTVRGDCNIKSRIYARNGVAEYWVVDINARRLIVHRSPTADVYGEVVTYRETEVVAPLSSPTSAVRVADLLP